MDYDSLRGSDPLNNREHERYPSEFVVRLRVKNSTEYTEEQSLNLSHGGIFLLTEDPVSRGTLVKLELQLDPVGETIQVEGMVVWTRPRMPDPKFPPGMGIKFVHISDEAQRLVDQTVEELARRQEEGSSSSPPGQGQAG